MLSIFTEFPAFRSANIAAQGVPQTAADKSLKTAENAKDSASWLQMKANGEKNISGVSDYTDTPTRVDAQPLTLVYQTAISNHRSLHRCSRQRR